MAVKMNKMNGERKREREREREREAFLMLFCWLDVLPDASSDS